LDIDPNIISRSTTNRRTRILMRSGSSAASVNLNPYLSRRPTGDNSCQLRDVGFQSKKRRQRGYWVVGVEIKCRKNSRGAATSLLFCNVRSFSGRFEPVIRGAPQDENPWKTVKSNGIQTGFRWNPTSASRFHWHTSARQWMPPSANVDHC
jgi:hypothetical protein